MLFGTRLAVDRRQHCLSLCEPPGEDFLISLRAWVCCRGVPRRGGQPRRLNPFRPPWLPGKGLAYKKDRTRVRSSAWKETPQQDARSEESLCRNALRCNPLHHSL